MTNVYEGNVIVIAGNDVQCSTKSKQEGSVRRAMLDQSGVMRGLIATILSTHTTTHEAYRLPYRLVWNLNSESQDQLEIKILKYIPDILKTYRPTFVKITSLYRLHGCTRA